MNSRRTPSTAGAIEMVRRAATLALLDRRSVTFLRYVTAQ
jgi:hypothetical protein